jgi:hypothetical protein
MILTLFLLGDVSEVVGLSDINASDYGVTIGFKPYVQIARYSHLWGKGQL